MDRLRTYIWLILAVILTILLPIWAFLAPPVLKILLWQAGSNPAVDVLQGEHLGGIIQAVLLSVAPVVPVLCFLLERIGVSMARRRAKTAEWVAWEQKPALYAPKRDKTQRESRGRHWIVYAILCALAIRLFYTGVLSTQLPQQIEETGRDLDAYRAHQFAIYEGPLHQVERQLRNGLREVPDGRFVYYDSTENSLRCAVSLLAEPRLMQETYTVAYLPETGTIVSITDADGVLRTTGEEIAFSTPPGYWMYGDLAVPVCSEVEGYGALSREQQALFDLMYSQVLSEGVASGKYPTRSFDLPYPLKKSEFRAVLDLYEASMARETRPTHGYRTDDEGTVYKAYCYGIIYSQ